MATQVVGTLFLTRAEALAATDTAGHYLGSQMNGTAPVCSMVRSGPGSVPTTCAPGDTFAGIVTTTDGGFAPLVAPSGLDGGELTLAPNVTQLCQPSQLSITWAAGVCRVAGA